MKNFLTLILSLAVTSLANGQQWTVYNTSNSSLLDNEITALGVGFGKIYAAADGGGVSTFDGTSWGNLDTSLIDDNCAVTDIAFASANDVWITTDDNCGLKRIVNDQLVFDSLIFNASLSTVEIDGEGTPWIGNYGNGGLYEYVGNGFISYNEWNSDNPNDYVWGIGIINDSTRWVVGTHEVGLMADSGWTVFNYLQNPYPLWWDVVAHGNQAAWFATNLGLVHFDGDTTFIVFDETNSGMPASGGIDDFPDLAMDQNGGIWMASFSGLIRFDGSNFTIYTTSNSGLPSNSVNVVEVDSANNVWAGTDNGLVRIVLENPNTISHQGHIQISAYPNPTSGEITLAGLKNTDGEMRILNVVGEEISSFPLTERIDVSNLTAGVYFLEINTVNGLQAIRLVKE